MRASLLGMVYLMYRRITGIGMALPRSFVHQYV